MRIADIRDIVRAVGPRGFVQVMTDLLEGRDQQGREVRKVRPEAFSIRALYEALVGPCDEYLDSYRRAGGD